MEQIQIQRRQDLAAAVGEDLLHQVRAALRRGLDGRDSPATEVFGAELVEQGRAVSQDGGQEVVEVVGQSSGHATQGLVPGRMGDGSLVTLVERRDRADDPRRGLGGSLPALGSLPDPEPGSVLGRDPILDVDPVRLTVLQCAPGQVDGAVILRMDASAPQRQRGPLAPRRQSEELVDLIGPDHLVGSDHPLRTADPRQLLEQLEATPGDAGGRCAFQDREFPVVAHGPLWDGGGGQVGGRTGMVARRAEQPRWVFPVAGVFTDRVWKSTGRNRRSHRGRSRVRPSGVLRRRSRAAGGPHERWRAPTRRQRRR